ncbi:MAG: hypothetical protein LBI05_05360, partial [Planctomycetaceae bacterium]|nr:hypothetical protein [Planctomycetaceae bacterium]
MILEQNIPDFVHWIGPAILVWLLEVAKLAAVALIVGAVITLILSGPSKFGASFGQFIMRGIEHTSFSPSRIWAIARLTIKESIRRRVLLVFAMFLILILI